MALNRQDCIVFDLLQTPIWIIDRNQLWYANRPALNIGLNERDIADFTGCSTTKCFYPIGENIYQCSVTKITIEDERPAILFEACLDTRYNLLLEASPDAIMITDADTGTIVQVNNKALSLTKKQAKDLIGLHHTQIYDETQRQEAENAFQQCVGGWCKGWFIPRNDRPSVPVDIYSTLFVSGNRRYLYGFFRDQTETKRIEKEWHNALSQLEQREEQLRVALSGANVICWEYFPKTDRVQGIGTFSPSGWEMLSWEMTLDEALTRIYAPDISRLKSKIYDKFGGGGTFFEEIRLADFSLLPRWFLVSGEVLLDQTGKPDRVVGITIEITAKKQVELELQSSRTMLESIMANIPSLVCIKDTQGRFTYINDNALRLFNISKEEVIGKTNREVFPPDLSLTLEYTERQVISTQKAVQTELELVQNGIPRTYFYIKFPLFNERHVFLGIGGITTDITELKQAESAIMQNQAYLNCLISIQQQLLTDDDRDHYPRILQQLGQTAKASRVYIFANYRSAEGILLSDQIYEWYAPGIKLEANNPELQNLSLEEFFPRWIKHFEAGQEIIGNVRDFPESERQILEPRGILSIL
ncbi:MAG: PAS domain S-box protein, partial [Cyanobacteria bacterium KgW148]|nr:PAS domain S-box protein [Cyanobacteria bacterium KgW148]